MSYSVYILNKILEWRISKFILDVINKAYSLTMIKILFIIPYFIPNAHKVLDYVQILVKNTVTSR